MELGGAVLGQLVGEQLLVAHPHPAAGHDPEAVVAELLEQAAQAGRDVGQEGRGDGIAGGDVHLLDLRERVRVDRLRQRRMLRRVHYVDAGSEHGDGRATRGQRAAIASAVARSSAARAATARRR